MLTKLMGIVGLVALLGLSLALAGCSSSKAVTKVPHVGFMSVSASPPFVEALKQGLRERGYVEGSTINIEWRFAKEEAELPGMADEFVGMKVDLIIAGGTKAIQAAMAKTKTIPIVMTNSGDAVETGLIASLARPGGNVTGLTQTSPRLSGKRIELLKEAIPGLSNIAVLWHQEHPTTPLSFLEVESAGKQLGVGIQSLPVRDSNEIEGAFKAAMQNQAGAMIALRDPMTIKNQQLIVDLAAKNHLPTMYETSNFVDAGGLMLYGPSFENLYRQSAIYVDKILKGANPAEMPVEQPTEFEFVINQKAADAIGLSLPEPVLVRASRVIH